MGLFYEKYLKRLEKERAKTPYTRTADLTVRRLAPKFAETKGRVEDMMRREGASPLAKARFALDEEGKVIDQMGNIYTEAQVRDIARQEEYTAKISETELKLEAEKKQEAKAKKSRTAQVWKTAAELVATGVGVATGLPLPAALGMGKLGGGIADIATGLDQTYESPENIVQGASSIIGGILSTTTAVSQQRLNTAFNKALSVISQLPAQEMELVLAKYEQALAGGYGGAVDMTALFEQAAYSKEWSWELRK